MYDRDKGLKKVVKGGEENGWNKRIKEIWKKLEKGREKELC